MDKTILITGASSGFGAATAKLFAAKGWRLILLARRENKLQALAEEIRPVEVLILAVDVCCREKIQQSLSVLPKKFQQIDVLLNGAGLALGLEPAHESELDNWDTMVDTNIKGLMYCTRAILPGMVARNKGHIVNIGSIAGCWPYPGGNAYGASKAFVQQFSRNLRSDLLGTAVRVTNIDPGLSETEFSIVRFKGDAEKADAVYKGTKPLLPENIAENVFWVISQPGHVNINSLEIMPTCQTWGPLPVYREK